MSSRWTGFTPGGRPDSSECTGVVLMIPVWWSRGEVTVTRPVRARCPTARCDRSAHHRDRCQGARVRGVTSQPAGVALSGPSYPYMRSTRGLAPPRSRARPCSDKRAFAGIARWGQGAASGRARKWSPLPEFEQDVADHRWAAWRSPVATLDAGWRCRPRPMAGRRRSSWTWRQGGDPEEGLIGGDPDDSGALKVSGPGKVTPPADPR